MYLKWIYYCKLQYKKALSFLVLPKRRIQYLLAASFYCVERASLVYLLVFTPFQKNRTANKHAFCVTIRKQTEHSAFCKIPLACCLNSRAKSNCSRGKSQKLLPCQTNQEDAESWLNLGEKETVFQVKVGPNG